MVHTGLQLVEQVDNVLLGHVQRDAFGLGHLLELDDGQILQSARSRDLFQLLRQLLSLFQRGLFFGQEFDQVILGA